MANCNPPVKNQAFDLCVHLYTSTGLITNPGTITAMISKDFGDYASVGTVTEEDSTYGQIKLALTATEMNADVVDIYVIDTTSGCIAFTCTIYTEDLTKAADALLKRDMSAVTGESSRSPLNALRFLRNKWSVSGTTLSVKEEDDSTEAWNATLTADAGANPIVGLDPS